MERLPTLEALIMFRMQRVADAIERGDFATADRSLRIVQAMLPIDARQEAKAKYDELRQIAEARRDDMNKKAREMDALDTAYYVPMAQREIDEEFTIGVYDAFCQVIHNNNLLIRMPPTVPTGQTPSIAPKISKIPKPVKEKFKFLPREGTTQ